MTATTKSIYATDGEVRRIAAIPMSEGIIEPNHGDFRVAIPPCGGVNAHEVARLDGERFEYWPGFGWQRSR
jgi:hypothetical protein